MPQDLVAFGKRLKTLRKAAGLTQKGLLHKLDDLHVTYSGIDQGLSGVSQQLISKWENAATHGGRTWPPNRQRILHLIEIFAEQLTLEQAQAWALQTGRHLNKTDLQAIVPDPLNQAPQLPHGHIRRTVLEDLVVDEIINNKTSALALWGIGGAGKTTLAAWIADLLQDQFPDGVIWIDSQPSMTVADILSHIADSLDVAVDDKPPAQLARKLHARLRKKRCLLVIDDLTSVDDLFHLRLGSATSPLICTTRDKNVATVLDMALIQVGGLTQDEGLAFLSKWGENADLIEELVALLGGLPLALRLCEAQLQAGFPLPDLAAELRQSRGNLDLLALDEPHTKGESLRLCFDITFRKLTPATQQHFAGLGCFVSHRLEEPALAAIWSIPLRQARQTFKQLTRYSLIQPVGQHFHIHPVLHEYAYEKLVSGQFDQHAIQQRHAAWFIRHVLYNPAVLDNATQTAPPLDHTWRDVVAGVTWAAHHYPQLATQTITLAHSDRAALFEEVGLPLIEAVERYLAEVADDTEQAIVHELLGDLYLLNEDVEAGIDHFEQASSLWQKQGKILFSSHAQLRVAGAFLLLQNRAAALNVVQQAQDLLSQCLPISDDQLGEAQDLFYWFNVIYLPLFRWDQLLEADVAALASLAEKTGQPILQARGIKIYRMWCTTDSIPRSEDIQHKGRQLALEAFYLWRACGRQDQADSDVSFTKYNLTNRFSRRTAIRYAKRKSAATPKLEPSQVKQIQQEGMRWWLTASETQRITWLSFALPRYLNASNRPPHPATGMLLPPLRPDSRAARWVNEILDVGALGGAGRRIMLQKHPPSDHILHPSEWRVFSGHKAISFAKTKAENLVENYLNTLEDGLK